MDAANQIGIDEIHARNPFAESRRRIAGRSGCGDAGICLTVELVLYQAGKERRE